MLRDEIIEEYKKLCEAMDVEKISRDEYRKCGKSTHLIDNIFGSWRAFMDVVGQTVSKTRKTAEIKRTTNANKVVITFAVDGQPINYECLDTLLNYSKINKCDFFILWGQDGKKKTGPGFKKDDFKKIKNYLATEICFDKDKKCQAKDLKISYSSKNPLVNLDKLSNYTTTFIVGSPKQYLRTLPYHPSGQYKIARSTGTISSIKYDSTVSGTLDKQHNTMGGLVLEYSESSQRYIVRELIYKNFMINDMGTIYTSNKKTPPSKDMSVPAMVLGDMHFPEEDEDCIEKTIELINKMNVDKVILHDIFSLNSISHHDLEKPLVQAIKSCSEGFVTLQEEMMTAGRKLDAMAKKCPNATFIVIHSNHDDFLSKYLNGSSWLYDRPNTLTAMRLFVDIAEGKNPFAEYFTSKNVKFLKEHEPLEICGYELGEHGHLGISGARGSAVSYSKTYSKSVSAHTHSPTTHETSVIVGTNSKLLLSYNGGITNWAHDNVAIYGNGTHQHIFLH
mgnify:CR=1 FL=1